MESENIENVDEVVQEGGVTELEPGVRVKFPTPKSLQQIWNTAQAFDFSVKPFLKNFSIGATTYTDRPLLLSDLALLVTPSTSITWLSGTPPDTRKTNIQSFFDSIPLAQYKHLPDISVLVMGGGSIDQSTLDTQEVSLPSESNEEDLPSLDIVEPSSIGGSYKRSSHKKRKSTRSRTKKNKKL